MRAIPALVLLSQAFLIALCASCSVSPPAPDPSTLPYVRYPGDRGLGVGKHIVFVTGDEEYRSEEGMPQLAQILARHHGFTCTVLFAVNKETGEIDPNTQDNIPGLKALRSADLMVIFTRFRDLPDEQMKHIVDYVESGRPIVGLRTATHAFQCRKHKTYRRFDWRSKQWPGGFGRQVLGETWIAHHGAHGRESARGVVAPGMEAHPILTGIQPGTVWDPADVYRVRLPLRDHDKAVLLGEVLAGMQPESEPAKAAAGKPDKNDPRMPVAWTSSYTTPRGARARVFATTMGSAPAFTQEGTRRMMVNACYWALGMAVPRKAEVGIVGDYAPTMFGFGKFKKGVKPADLRWR